MRLSQLIEPIFKKNTKLFTPFLIEYCKTADQPGTEKKYHYGYGSLKWALIKLEEINKSEIKNTLYGVILEYNLDMLSQHDIQFRILKSYFFRKYRQEMNESTLTKDVTKFETFKAGNFIVTINNTGHNLTTRIFRHTTTDAIISLNNELKSAGIYLRVNSKINLLEGFKNYLLDNLSTMEPGWRSIGDNLNYIVNLGIQSKTPTTLNIDVIKKLIVNYFNNK